MHYASPIQPISDIVNIFKESNIIVTENDFKNPEQRRWYEIYGKMFELVTGRPIEQVVQSMLRVEKMQTEHYELFDDGFATLAFTSCMKTVFSHCGFSSFSVKDLTQPSTKRLQKCLSTFINATRFIEGREQFCIEVLHQMRASKNDADNVVHHNKKLKECLLSAREAQPQKEAELNMYIAEFEHQAQVMNEVTRISEEDRREADEIKLMITELGSDKENIKQQLLSVQQDVEKLSHKIVQSPKRFKQESKRYRSKVEEAKIELARKEHNLSENRHLLENTANKLNVSEKAVKLIKDVQSDTDSQSEIDVEIKRLMESFNELKETYHSLCLSDEDLTELLRVRQEHRQKLASQVDNIKDSAHQELIDSRQYEEKLKEKVKSLAQQVSQLVSAGAAHLSEWKAMEVLEGQMEQENQLLFQNIAAEIEAIQALVIDEFAARRQD